MQILFVYPAGGLQNSRCTDGANEPFGPATPLPPLALLAAALRPLRDWQPTIVDRSMSDLTEGDLARADLVVLRSPILLTADQILSDLQRLNDLGWRHSVLLNDASLAGDRQSARALVSDLYRWMTDHDHPFTLTARASVDLAEDPSLLTAMVEANFSAVILDLPVPSAATGGVERAVRTISGSGLRVIAHFALTAAEPAGVGQRLVDFVESAAIPVAALTLPDVGATDRHGRELVSAFWRLYDPNAFLNRTFRHYTDLGDRQPARVLPRDFAEAPLRALTRILWHQGVKRETRFNFWRRLWQLRKLHPAFLAGYLATCAQLEHFLPYRSRWRTQFQQGLPDAPMYRPTVQVTLTGATLKLPSDRKQAVPQS